MGDMEQWRAEQRKWIDEQRDFFKKAREERRERIRNHYPKILTDLGFSNFELEYSDKFEYIDIKMTGSSKIKYIRCGCKNGDLMTDENTFALNDIFQILRCIETIRNGEVHIPVINSLKQKGFYGIHHDHRVDRNFARLKIMASKMDMGYEFSVYYDVSSSRIATNSNSIDFDRMDGYQFEQFCAELLTKRGYEDVTVTQGSGDQGVDIIAYRDGVKYGIQCKCYNSAVGNKAVQEVFAGKTFYQCHVGIVITNNYFTSSAIELAQQNGIILWNRDKLQQMIAESR